ncbi:hypothetical protein LDO32_05520, partial [Luteimonas sp. Y-2-2-4F]
MSYSKHRGVRRRVLATATALALFSIAAAPVAAGEVDVSGLSADAAFDQFIVTYRDGAAAHTDPAALERSLDTAASAVAGAASATSRAVRPLRAAHQRRLGIG